MSLKPFERIKREVAYQGSMVQFCKDTLKLPNGNVVEWDFVNHHGAAAVVAVTPEDKILMVRQYRPSLDRFVLEIPAGGLEEGESYEEAARRELEEETGYACEELFFLYHLQTTVAFTNERIGVCVAKGLTKTKQHLDEDEFVEIESYTIEELEQMIFDGIIQDGKTISSLLIYKNRFCK